MGSELLIVVGLLMANGLFAGAEIAVLSVRKTRLRELARRKDRRALAVTKLRDTPERFLATVQIAMTLLGTTAAAVGGARMEHSLEPTYTRLGAGSWSPSLSFATIIALVTFLELVIGELVPKSLGLRYSDRYSGFVARPLLALSQLMRPLVWLLTLVSNLVLRIFGDRTTFTEARLSKDELQQLVEEAAKTGSVDPRASEIASRALGFGEVTVAEVMVPRNRVVALRRSSPAEEVQRTILEEGHTRMPVYDGNIDNITGYVVARDVLAIVWEKGLVVLEDILRPAHKVPESTRALDLLREMQRRRTQMAIVIDDNGGLSGLVTTEDLIEELVGDIMNEDDVPESLLRARAERDDPRPGLGGGAQGQPRPPPRPAGRQRSHDDRRPVHVARAGDPAGGREARDRERHRARGDRSIAAAGQARTDPSGGTGRRRRQPGPLIRI